MDIIYYDYSNTSTRKILYFTEKKEKKEINFNDMILFDEEKCQNGKEEKIPIAENHASAYVDINGDCVSDLLIHSKLGNKNYLEFWIGMKINEEIKYCLKEKKVLNENLGLFSLVDINVDGQLDLAFPILNSQPPKVYVAYNRIKVENDWSNNYCETAQKKKYNKTEPLFEDLDLKVNNVRNFLIKFY